MGSDDEPEPFPPPPPRPTTAMAISEEDNDDEYPRFVLEGNQWYEVHIFKTVGSYSLSFADPAPASVTADILIVGGGGGSGGYRQGKKDRSGGGGAGGPGGTPGGGPGWIPADNGAGWITETAGVAVFACGGNGTESSPSSSGYGNGGSVTASITGVSGDSGIVIIRFPHDGRE